MAKSPKNGSIAFVAEVARYLCVDPVDVQAMIRISKLPHFKIPKTTRSVYRIPLRDFFNWLRQRSGYTAFTDYEAFLADFDKTARTKGKGRNLESGESSLV